MYIYDQNVCDFFVAYLGPSGSYSELALNSRFYTSKKLECRSIAEIFDCVDKGQVDLGLVPIENVIQGTVTETLDLLLEYRDRILGSGQQTDRSNR